MIKVSRAAVLPTYSGPGDARTKVVVGPGMGAENMSLAVLVMPPGGKTDVHVRDAEECIYVVRGRTIVTAGKARVEIGAGDAIVIPAGVEHYHENAGDGELEQIAVWSPAGPERMILNLPLARD